MYNFETLDDNTLTIIEGERLKIIQMHDDNLNSEWWLVEKNESNKIGYVPSNYVRLCEAVVSTSDCSTSSSSIKISSNIDNNNLNYNETSLNSNDSDLNASAII